jgi:hypothetical protein
VTTNLPFEQWTEVLGSERLTGVYGDDYFSGLTTIRFPVEAIR